MTEQRLKPLRGDGAKLLKMVQEAADLQTLEQALELSAAIGQPAEGLLDGMAVTAAGELLYSSRFRGTQATQPALDLLLVHQLALALPGTPEADLRCAVRSLDLRCPVLPPLRGFDGLDTLSLTVPEGAQWSDLSAWGPLPALQTLVITNGGTKDRPSCLQSLAGLHAPALEDVRLKGLGLVSIDGLQSSSRLRTVDLAQNPQLTSLAALAAAAAALEDLKLEGCEQVDGLEALAGAVALTTLNLKGCARVPSLQPLASSRELSVIDLEGCASLASLEGLCGPSVRPPRYRFFNFNGCAALTSLRGLPPLHEEVDSLRLEDMPALASLEGIEAAGGITSIEIDGTALTDLQGLAGLVQLKEVRVFGCKALEDVRVLGTLPALARVRVSGSPRLQYLPAVWGERLRNLELYEGAFTALGQLPAALERLEVREIGSLLDLRGVEKATALKEVAVDTYLRDASALNGLPLACVRCFNSDKVDLTPAWVHATLRGLNPLRLDLSYTGLKELQFLIELPQLEQLHVGHDACDFYGFKGTEHLTQAAVRTLQRVVCKKHQLPVPEFLKPRRASKQAAASGGPSLADVKRGLSSTDFLEVVAALDALRACGDASLYDAVFDGVHGPTMYTGDTAPLGKMFREIRAHYRTWARWALTHALMDAPQDCASAQALCNSIESIHLHVSLAHRPDAGKPLALGRFKALKSFTLQGTEDENLAFLSELGPLKSLSLLDLPKLASLEGLASMASLPSLQTLKLDKCPKLQSLKGLEGATQLQMITASDCEALRDFTAMSGMRALTVFPGWSLRVGQINLSGYGALKDVGFLTGLASAESLTLRLEGRVDLSPLAQLTRLQSLELELDTLDQDFSPLVGLKALDVQLIDPETGYSLSVEGKAKPGQGHVWQGEFPVLQTLELSGGEHDLSQLRAPALQTFKSYARQVSLRGVGHAGTVEFIVHYCGSLEGLAGSPVTALNLHCAPREGVKPPSFAVVHEVPDLHTLCIGPALTEQHARELTACAQVQSLQASSFKGSLAFLAGWERLAEIDLRNSGELTDLETLCGLPSLTLVRLRGAAMKREAWPKALQDRLDFRSS
jgi:Leucine-rich repeat (LRR) protein